MTPTNFQTAGDGVPAVSVYGNSVYLCICVCICVCVTTFCLAKIETNTLLG